MSSLFFRLFSKFRRTTYELSRTCSRYLFRT
nr:MAG TPA: hypothetical protein [Caudoviricetes sp.]